MTAPIFDPALITAALEAGLDAALDVHVAEIGDPDQARERRALRGARGVLVTADRTAVSGGIGIGNDRTVTETFALLIQWRDVSPDGGATARAGLRAIRAGVYAVLEGASLDADWAPLRYEGGNLLGLDERDASHQWVERYATETTTPMRPVT